MSTFSSNTTLCRYHHDALDRLVGSALPTSDSLQRFYCKTRLTTEIKGSVRHSLLQHDDQPLAQQQHRDGRTTATLLATDRQRSVCNVLDATQNKPIVYTAYGHRSSENGVLSLLGFNGERPDPLTGHYHLGNGYRQFNPVLMRFNSPDNLSPFEKGGLNPYVYCVGDPVNRSDPTGHFSGLLLAGIIGLVVGTASAAAAEIVEDDTLAYALDGLAVVSASFAAFAFGGYAFKGRGLKGRGLRGSRGAPARAQTGDFEMRSLTSNANPARQPASPPRSSPSSSPNQGSFSRPQTSGSVSPKIEFGRRDNILRIPRVRSPQNPEITNIRTS